MLPGRRYVLCSISKDHSILKQKDGGRVRASSIHLWHIWHRAWISRSQLRPHPASRLRPRCSATRQSPAAASGLRLQQHWRPPSRLNSPAVSATIAANNPRSPPGTAPFTFLEDATVAHRPRQPETDGAAAPRLRSSAPARSIPHTRFVALPWPIVWAPRVYPFP